MRRAPGDQSRNNAGPQITVQNGTNEVVNQHSLQSDQHLNVENDDNSAANYNAEEEKEGEQLNHIENLGPGMTCPVIICDKSKCLEIDIMIWGMIPHYFAP